MKRKPPITQYELPIARQVFNLSAQSGEDGERRADEQRRRKEWENYLARMQRTFEQCPGFVGGDVPQGPAMSGNIVIDPVYVKAAMPWLKRRFAVNASATVEATGELRVEVRSRARPEKSGNVRRVRVSFAPVEQFTLPL